MPFAARQAFLADGIAVVRRAIDPEIAHQLGRAALGAAAARRRQLCEIPPMDTIFRKQSKLSDPALQAVATHLEKRRYVLHYMKLQRKRRRERQKIVAKFLNGRRREDLTGEDLWKLSTLLQEQVCKASGAQCTSTIHNDPQMLQAISEYRANLWMTSRELQASLLSSPVSWALGAIAETVGGVEKPVLFGDSPVYREAFGAGAGYQCTAPLIGTSTTARRPASAVSIILFASPPSPLCLEPHVLSGSHRFVREQLGAHRGMLRRLFSAFRLSESHLPFQLQHFQFGPAVRGVRLAELLPGPALEPGDALVVDPHLLLGFGPNMTDGPALAYRLHAVSEDARASMWSPSWIRGWRSLPQEVSFRSPVVFPKLHAS